MEEKTTAGETRRPGCILCAAMPLLEQCWPEAARNHFRASRVEFLKGIRSLLDERIGRLSREEPKGTHVNVE